MKDSNTKYGWFPKLFLSVVLIGFPSAVIFLCAMMTYTCNRNTPAVEVRCVLYNPKVFNKQHMPTKPETSVYERTDTRERREFLGNLGKTGEVFLVPWNDLKVWRD